MTRDGIFLRADKGKALYCTFNEINYGSEIALGYLYYDKDGNLLPEPYLLTEADFIEIDIEEKETKNN